MKRPWIIVCILLVVIAGVGWWAGWSFGQQSKPDPFVSPVTVAGAPVTSLAVSSDMFYEWYMEKIVDPFPQYICGPDDVWEECRPPREKIEYITFTLPSHYRPNTFVSAMGYWYMEGDQPPPGSWPPPEPNPPSFAVPTDTLHYTMTLDARVVPVGDSNLMDLWVRASFSIGDWENIRWLCDSDVARDGEGFCRVAQVKRGPRFMFFPFMSVNSEVK